MAGDKSRKCPTCHEVKSGRKFKNSEQCTECRRDIDRAHHPPKCRTCPQLFSRDTFHFEKTGRGWRKECKTCHGQQQKNHNADRENQPPRVCKRCDVEKAATEFKDQRLMCTACKLEEDRKKAALVPKANPETLDKPSTCGRCHKPMGPQDLTLRQDTHLGSYRPHCKSCLGTAKDGSDHCQNSRKRQQERPDYPDVKRHKNEQHQDWHARHPEKKAEYQATYRALGECKMRQIIQSAKQRGISVVEEDVPAMTEMLKEPCVYCAYLPAAGQPLNGLDRVDSSFKEYSTANTVPCCAACNHIKASYTQSFFLLRAKTIALQHPLTERLSPAAADAAFRQQCSRYCETSEKLDDLTKEERLEFWASPCYLCGSGPAMGIDRVDSSGHYQAPNCRPCCGPCNYMKSSVPLALFLSKIKDIQLASGYLVLGNVDQISTQPGRILSPVEIFSGTEILARFPSRSSAARVLGVSIPTISASIGSTFRGGNWRDLDVSAYINSAPLQAKVVMAYLSQATQKPVKMKRSLDVEPGYPRKPRSGARVLVVDAEGAETSFTSQSAAAKFVGCSQATISKAPNPWQFKTFVVRK